jgi:hypothetical protein
VAALPADASVDQMSDDGPGCSIDASIATFNFPDAALGDSGGTATACGSCLNTNCGSAVAACDEECACLEATKAVLACGADGGTAFTCAMSAPQDTNFFTLALCIFDSCASPCALSALVDAGTLGVDSDAGAAMTGDASLDAASAADAAGDSAEQ